MILVFIECSDAILTDEFPAPCRQERLMLTRVARDNVVLFEELTKKSISNGVYYIVSSLFL